MKLKTLLMAPIILAAAGYGGAKAYIYFTVKSELDNLVEMAAPFADISYGGISSDLRGKLAITDVAVVSLAGGETMEVQTLQLRGPGTGFLFDLSSGFKNGQPPRSLALTMERVSVPIDQGFNANFGLTGTGTAAGPAYQPKPCTLGGILQHKGLQQMGMDKLVADVHFGYSFDQDIGEAEVFFDYQLDETESFSMAMQLADLQAPGAMAMGSLPRFGNFDLTYQVESGYIKRMLDHCAQQRNQTPDAFVEAMFDISDSQYARQLGFIPGPGIRAMLKTLVSKGGTVNVTANPPADLNPAMLAFYKPEDIVTMLGLEVSLDDQPVRDISVTVPEGAAAPAWMPDMPSFAQADDQFATQQADAGDQIESSVERQRKRRPRLSYQDTRVGDLHQYVGNKVRLYTGNARKPKSGFLISLKGGHASVEQSVHSGTMTAHLRLSDIRRAEVLRGIKSTTLTQ